MRNEIYLWVGYIAFLLIVFFCVQFFFGCDSGWSIAGWEVK